MKKKKESNYWLEELAKRDIINLNLAEAIQRLETEKAYMQGLVSEYSDALKTIDAENQRLKKIVDQWIEVKS